MTAAAILVTGGAGYIGSHVCKALAVKGYKPVTYDNLSRGNRSAVKWGPLEIGDLADQPRLRAVLAKYQPAAVMHFAAYSYVGESVEQPALYYQNNVGGSTSLIDAIVETQIVPVIFSSTCATYGVPERTPISEDHPQRPINPYGFSKLVIERMLAEAKATHGLRSLSLRYFNAAGADPDGEIGEAHEPETHLIPRVLMAARDRAAITVYGNDYPTPDGTCIRDYVHVADLANAHILALEDMLAGGASGALNLANARGHSVMEVIETARLECGADIRVEVAPRRPGDPPILVGAAERARARLGWSPQRSALAMQIEDAWRWIKSKGTRKS